MKSLAMNRRTFLQATAAALMGGASSSQAQTLGLSGRTVSLVVPYPAGGIVDVVARALQPHIGKALGSTVIVENIGGGSGAIGAQRVLSAPADNPMILLASANEVILAPLAIRAVKYRSSDFQPIAFTCTGPNVLVARPDLPVSNVDELVAYAKRPGAKGMSYASTGYGSGAHLLGAMLAAENGLNLLHVPYRGAMPGIQDVAAGRVDLFFVPLAPVFVQMVEAGRLKLLGQATEKRFPLAADLPAFGESRSARRVVMDAWLGLFTASSVSAKQVATWHAAGSAAAHAPEAEETLKSAGMAPDAPETLAETQTRYTREIASYSSAARGVGLEPV